MSLKEKPYILYSRKYWRELNLAVGPKIAIAKISVDLNLGVWQGIAIHIYASRKYWRILIWRLQRQTAKRPNFLAIRYMYYVWDVFSPCLDDTLGLVRTSHLRK